MKMNDEQNRRSAGETSAGRRGDLSGPGERAVLPFEDQAFDAVLLSLTLSVVPDPVARLREGARSKRPRV